MFVACDDSWDVLGYVLCVAVLVRFLWTSKKVRTAFNIARIFCKLAVDSWTFYGKRVLRRLKAKKEEPFSGDPNQPIMRRPMMRAPVTRAIPPVDIEALLKSLPVSSVEGSQGQVSGIKSCETCETHDKTE